MKGYRTIVIAAVAAFAAILGKHLAPDQMSAYADVIAAGLALLFGVLRFVTSTPVGQKVVADVASDIGLSKDELDAAMADAVAGTTLDLKSQVSTLSTAIEKLSGHPLFSPATADAVATLAELLPQINASLTPAPSPAADPAPAAASPS